MMPGTDHNQSLQEYLAHRAKAPLPGLSTTIDDGPKQTEKALVHIHNLLGDTKPKEPTPFDLEETHRRVSELWARQRSLEEVNRMDRRRLPWVLFYGGEPNEWFSADRGFRESFGAWLKSQRSASLVSAFLFVLLRDYPKDRPELKGWLQLARELLERHRSIRLRKWREREAEFQLFSEEGPEAFGERWSAAESPGAGFLESAGFSQGLESARFLNIAVQRYLECIQNALSREQINSVRLMLLLKPLEGNEGLRFPEHRVRTLNALLKPFHNSKPADELKSVISDFVLRHIGDPRTRRNAWQGADDARDVMLRWLVSVTLEAFFEIVDQTAMDQHWHARKAFWSAYLNNDAIQDARVILGSRAKKLALYQSQELRGTFGSLRGGGGVQGGHSVLLMRMNSLVIAEWSHSSSCSFWRIDDLHAPAFRLGEYSVDELKQADRSLRFRHAPKDGLRRWERKFAGFVEQETGIQNPNWRSYGYRY
ncbi:MAG: hypothetical protein KDH09_07935 [Chrysiogenetes bacterium]|nr:hypothetical protein [Chrysiogenetes bacterium]